jgi:hypothetical protein
MLRKKKVLKIYLKKKKIIKNIKKGNIPITKITVLLEIMINIIIVITIITIKIIIIVVVKNFIIVKM